MCFSMQASFATAAALSFVGCLALKDAQARLRPIAAIPLLFALQQMFEGVVWWTTTLNRGHTISTLHLMAVYGFLFFAYLFWPAYIPITLHALEPNRQRKKALRVCIAAGIGVVLISIFSWLQYGVYAQVVDHHIVYANAITSHLGSLYWISLGMYLLATAGAFCTSSIRYMWLLGILVTGACMVAHTWYQTAFGSVWCFFAAIGSGIIYYVVTHATNRKDS